MLHHNFQLEKVPSVIFDEKKPHIVVALKKEKKGNVMGRKKEKFEQISRRGI